MDHYAALGLSRSADAEAVRAAYRDAVRRWHPDRDPSPEAAAKFLAAQRAFQVLSDPRRRVEYDRETANGIGDLLLIPLPFLRKQVDAAGPWRQRRAGRSGRASQASSERLMSRPN